MTQQLRFSKTAIGWGLFLLTGYSCIFWNEAIFPSAIVGSLIFLFSLRSGNIAASQDSAAGNAAHCAIRTFAVFFAVLSLLVSFFLPPVSAYYKLDGLFDGDFVRVTINDMHEYCYSVCLLLAVEALFRFYFMKKKKCFAPEHSLRRE